MSPAYQASTSRERYIALNTTRDSQSGPIEKCMLGDRDFLVLQADAVSLALTMHDGTGTRSGTIAPVRQDSAWRVDRLDPQPHLP